MFGLETESIQGSLYVVWINVYTYLRLLGQLSQIGGMWDS